MGILNKFFGGKASIQQLPAGTITIDRQGRIISSTVASSFPEPLLQKIGQGIMELFQEAKAGQVPMAEINLHYASVRITARELRGGAIIFLCPSGPPTNTPYTS